MLLCHKNGSYYGFLQKKFNGIGSRAADVVSLASRKRSTNENSLKLTPKDILQRSTRCMTPERRHSEAAEMLREIWGRVPRRVSPFEHPNSTVFFATKADADSFGMSSQGKGFSILNLMILDFCEMPKMLR